MVVSTISKTVILRPRLWFSCRALFKTLLCGFVCYKCNRQCASFVMLLSVSPWWRVDHLCSSIGSTLYYASFRSSFLFFCLNFILSFLQTFHGQPMPTTVPTAPHPPAMRPRVRARRGQATDPHSIAERVGSRIFSKIWILCLLIMLNVEWGLNHIANILICWYFFTLLFAIQ